MPFEIVRNDIVNMHVDAIVNTANPRPVVGSGVDSAIHKAAGPELLEARMEIGDLRVGTSAATPAFGLPAKYVLHTCGPVWEDGNQREEDLLKQSYRSALELADELDCKSVAFPLLSSGNYGFPKERSLQIAIQEFGDFLFDHDMLVYLVVFNGDAYRMSSSLFSSVQSFIDEHYVEEKTAEEYTDGAMNLAGRRREARRLEDAVLFGAASYDMLEEPVLESASEPDDLLEEFKEIMRTLDAGFSDTLIALIDATGKKRSEIYTKACISKQHFSKINSNSNYQPTKPTVIAFAFALELDREATEMLLNRAGFTFSRHIKFDVVVEGFLEKKEFRISELNEALDFYDLPPVGCVVA